jgi:DNA-binding transcriptional LysR family regulator
VEVRQLQCFVAVAEELHFGRAAARLGIVQPAVSQQVARLERELGVRLLERSSRRVALTGDGERLLVEARGALAALDRVRSVAAELAAGRAGRLRIGTSPGLGERLPRGVARLRHDGDLDVVLVPGSPLDHFGALRAGELDVALVRGPVGVRGLHAVELWRDILHLVLPATHRAAARPSVPVVLLSEIVLRLPDRIADAALHDTVLAACHAAGFTPAMGRPVRSMEDAVVEIGTSHREATVVYGAACAPASRAAGTIAIRPFDPPLEVPGHLVTAAPEAPGCRAVLAAAFGDQDGPE